eukprot:m.181902 g.181902  ORF g.181902 m.181902 type:complete len:227 (-) comp17448_c1_seq12:3429-4109(-)
MSSNSSSNAGLDSNAEPQTQKRFESITVRPYRAADRQAACDIFSQGMAFYGTHPRIEALLQPAFIAYCQNALATDLSNMDTVYDAEKPVVPGGRRGNFWVAEAQPGSVVVGIVGLEAKADGDCELRRMSVSEVARGQGVARLLIDALEAWALQQGFRRIFLSTLDKMWLAMQLYPRFGYRETHRHDFSDDVPSRPRGVANIVYFEKHLPVPSAAAEAAGTSSVQSS